MVINDEIKFPRTIKVDAFKTETKVHNVDHIPPIEKIGKFNRRWAENRERQNREKGKKLLSAAEHKAVRSMVDGVNDDLNRHGVLIHLVLTKDEDGYAIDVFDCTDAITCKIVKDIIINVDDLPILLRNLARETGLIFDQVL